MKIERIFTESASIFNSVSAEKLLKEEKQILSADAVILDSDKQRQNQFQPQNDKNPNDKDKEDPSKEKMVQVKEMKGLGKKIDVIA